MFLSNNNNKLAWRLIAILGFILMSIRLYGSIVKVSQMENIFYREPHEILPEVASPIFFFASSLAFLFLIIRPMSFRVYFIFSVIFLIDGLIGGGRNYLLYLFALSLLTAYRSGYLQKNARIKILISSILFTLLLLTQIRYGFLYFIMTSLEVFGTALILLVTALLLSEEINKFIKLNHPEVLMLSSVPNLTDRDKNFVRSIFNGEKFAYIASSNHVSLGTVKNRMSELYKIIGVADKTELLIRYNDYSE